MIDSDTLLPNFARAVIQLKRKVHYKHFTAVAVDKVRYNPKIVKSDLAREIMKRILAVQYRLQKFCVSRRHAPDRVPRSLGNSIHKQYGCIGTVCQRTGKVIIKKKLRKLLKKYEVWNDFNSKKKRK